jgi:hypothetical protein
MPLQLTRSTKSGETTLGDPVAAKAEHFNKSATLAATRTHCSCATLTEFLRNPLAGTQTVLQCPADTNSVGLP